MRGRRLLLLFPLLAILGLVLGPAVVLAAPPGQKGPGDGTIQVGQDWVLESGLEHRGDVMVISGDAIIEAGATLSGNLAVVSGDVRVQGTVRGDINVISGDVILADGSRVTGDVNVVSGEVQQSANAVVEGRVTYNRFELPLFRAPVLGVSNALTLSVPEPWSPRWFAWVVLRFVLGLFRALLVAMAVAAVGALLAAIWPEQLARVARVSQEAGFPAFVTGIVTALVTALVAVVLGITICLLPFSLLLVMALLAAGLMGWAALGWLVGQKLWEGLGQEPAGAVLPTAVGSFLLTLLTNVPCVGAIFFLAVGSIGLGAVILSQFGMREPVWGRQAVG